MNETKKLTDHFSGEYHLFKEQIVVRFKIISQTGLLSHT